MADAPPLNADFADFLRALAHEEVRFLVVGAHALAAHGVVRSTGDLDVLVRPDPENARRLVRALQRFGAPLAAHGVREEDFAVEGTVYQLGLPPRRIDVLTKIAGVTFDAAEASSRAMRLGEGAEFRVPSRATLVRNKRAAGRPKDLEDARLLEEIDGST